jgi:MGT family glycosyltransferase
MEPEIAEPLNHLRAAAGLPPDPRQAMLYRYLLLSPFPRSFEHADLPLPPTAHSLRVEPFDRSGSETLPPWLEALPPRPIVYVTLGTSPLRRTDVFRTLVVGLYDEPLHVVATVGRTRDPAALGPQPPHIHVERYIPQSLLLTRCALVVCHGGSGTVLGALSLGLPLVVVPQGADQPENAAQVAALGAGRVIEPADLTPAAVRAAVRAVLGDPSYRRSAAAVQEEIASLPGVDSAVALLERLEREREPLYPPRL